MRTLLILCVLSLTTGGVVAQDKKPDDPKQVLARWLKDIKQSGDEQRQLDAAMGLADFGPLAEPALPDLLMLLRSKNEDLRLNAAIALGKIGQPAVASLAELVDDKDKDVRFY